MKRDLVVLVPDKDIEQTITGLLARPEALSIRPVSVASIIVHPNRDPGVYRSAHALLRPLADEAERALVLFDRAWGGAPDDNAVALAEQVEARCAPVWRDCVRCVCIDPEIESWIWSDSPHVPIALGWENRQTLTTWLRGHGLWSSDAVKPHDPKGAFEAATRARRVVPSSIHFRAARADSWGESVSGSILPSVAGDSPHLVPPIWLRALAAAVRVTSNFGAHLSPSPDKTV